MVLSTVLIFFPTSTTPSVKLLCKFNNAAMDVNTSVRKIFHIEIHYIVYVTCLFSEMLSVKKCHRLTVFVGGGGFGENISL